MKAFIKKEKTAKSGLDLKDHLDKLASKHKKQVSHQLAPIASEVSHSRGHYTPDDIAQVISLKNVYADEE